jgi:cobalt-zinc-cadmium efflux system membrane fusion protein
MSDAPHPSDSARVAARGWPIPRQRRALAIGALVVVALLALIWLIGRWRAPPPPPPRPPPGTFRPTAGQLKSFTVATVSLHSFRDAAIAEGKIAVDADRATPVYSPFSGRVVRVIAALGASVERGAPLATIAASEFVQGQDDLAAASAQVKLAQASEARKHALYDARGGSLQDWQQAQAELATAEANLKAVENRLRILGKSDADIAALAQAKRMDATASLVAPIAGVVVDRQVGPGQVVQAAGAALFTVADVSSVWLVANVREIDAARVHVGQTVEVTVMGLPGRTFEARVASVAAMVDTTTRRIAVRAVLDNRERLLKPEMFANFRIITDAGRESPAVPAAAVVYEGDSAHVWALETGDVIRLRPVRTGLSGDGLVEILEGLKAGERVIVRGSLFIDRAAGSG